MVALKIKTTIEPIAGLNQLHTLSQLQTSCCFLAYSYRIVFHRVLSFTNAVHKVSTPLFFLRNKSCAVGILQCVGEWYSCAHA